MEYREAPASPSASSVTTTLSLENCGSPETPNSPSAQDEQGMDHDRLPNELLDELCEDIGMGEGTELDFVEFLMEQDVDPQHYMTAEALRSSGFPTPTNKSHTNSALNTPTNKTSNENWGNNRNCGSPSFSTASSTNVTVATSSGSSSPVSKRFHLSNSGPPSPPTLSHTTNHVFKAPQTPPTSRRPGSTSHGAMSPRSNLSVSSNQSNHSDHSSHSNHSVHSNQSNVNQNTVPQRCFSPKTTFGSAQLPHSTTGGQGFNKPPPQYGQYPGQGQIAQKKPVNQAYQRFGRPVPPNVNVQNFQQQENKFMSPNASQGAPSCAMNSSGSHDNMAMTVQSQANPHFNRPLESPLDQGYFTSSDSMSTRSLDSAASTVPSSVQSSVQSINTQQKLTIGATPQKSVHFADNSTANCTRQNGGLPYEPCYRNNVPDCELEEYRNSLQKMQNKMLPRLNHHVKPETAPYTVPTNTGQAVNPFEYPNANNTMQQQQQQYEFQQHKSSGARFGIENNQNMMLPGYTENLSNQTTMNCQMPNGPMGGMHQGSVEGFRGQGACHMQDPSKAAGMFDPMQNNMVKNSNCQFSGQTQGNMTDGMMGMNQGMMVNGHMPQGSVNQNYGNSQSFQGMASHSQHGYQGQGQRNMNMSSVATGSSGMMGYDHQFEQNRAISGNMNMNNMDGSGGLFPQGQGNTIAETLGWNGNMPQTPQSHPMGSQSGSMNMQGQGIGMGQGDQCGQLSGIPCVIPNCANCKNVSSPNRPPMMENQQRFIQHLITDRSNAFRSHPLFPLLRDLIIADMNFSTPNFPYQLISNLPADFNKLLQNFLHRNPPQGNYQTNFAVESVVMDALKYAHHCLIGKQSKGPLTHYQSKFEKQLHM